MSELEQIFSCAVRYALGRCTYITSVVSDYIIRQENLSTAFRNVVIRDIEECKDYGHACDKQNWMRLLEHLKNYDKKA